MKKQLSKSNILSVVLSVLASLVLSSCVSNPIDDTFTAEDLAPQSTVSTVAVQMNLKAELDSIDAQLASIEAQIEGAQSRLTSYQAQALAGVNQSLMSGAEAEISHYQILKNNLMVRKQEINAESALIQ